MIAGVNVSNCFWYRLTWVVLDERAVKMLLVCLFLRQSALCTDI